MTRKNTFPNPELYQAKKQLGKRFDKILFDLIKMFKHSGQTTKILEQFRECLKNPEQMDMTRMPIYTNSPTSKRAEKLSCLLNFISYIIPFYWNLCNGNLIVKDKIDHCLIELEQISKQGLDTYKVVGIYPSYYLQKIK